MPPRAPKEEKAGFWQHLRALPDVFRQLPRAIRLVLKADAVSALGIMALQFLRSLVPLATAWVGKLLVDGVVAASKSGSAADQKQVLYWVAVEFGLMLLTGFLGQGAGLLRTLLGTKLGYLINIQILEKAQTLELAHFENPKIYDMLQNARREASSRPLNLFTNTVETVGNIITLTSYAIVLLTFSAWTLLILAAATVPSFLVEAKFSGQAFRLFTWRAPEGRKMRYLESILTRDSNAKEVKLYAIGPLIMERYRALYQKFFGEERALAVRRSFWGFVLGALSTGALYICYAWIVARTVTGALTLGDMTLYITVFRQGQTALRSILRALGKTYEDNLFMSNLFGFLEMPVRSPRGPEEPAPEPSPDLSPKPSAKRASEKVDPKDRGFVLENVSFVYPGTRKVTLDNVSLRIGPEEKLAIVGENGAGKTTLIKLLCGLYQPTRGKIYLDGKPLSEIPQDVLRRRFGVVLQDFVRYQFTARDNIGLGRPDKIEDQSLIERAADKGGAQAVIEDLEKGYDTQLGRWFEGGVELSGGNWQKVAVSRAFMRSADILVLDEPTAALDAEAEHALFERFRELTEKRMALLISHRFSTVRMADRIVVLSQGQVQEMGTHQELLEADGRYAHLFHLQAKGYVLDD